MAMGGQMFAGAGGASGPPAFLANVAAVGEKLGKALHDLAAAHPQSIRAVRGRRLMWGVDPHRTASEVIDAARAQGLLVLSAGGEDAATIAAVDHRVAGDRRSL